MKVLVLNSKSRNIVRVIVNKTDNKWWKCFLNLSKQGGRVVRVVLLEEVVHTDYLTQLHTPLQARKLLKILSQWSHLRISSTDSVVWAIWYGIVSTVDSLLTDTSLRRTLSAGPKGVRLGESWLYYPVVFKFERGPDEDFNHRFKSYKRLIQHNKQNDRKVQLRGFY